MKTTMIGTVLALALMGCVSERVQKVGVGQAPTPRAPDGLQGCQPWHDVCMVPKKDEKTRNIHRYPVSEQGYATEHRNGARNKVTR